MACCVRGAVMVVCALCGAANATIVGVSGPVDLVAPPPDAGVDKYVNGQRIRVWNEKQDVLLTNELAIDARNPGVYDATGDLGNLAIEAGVRVASHYVHFDGPENERFVLEAGVVRFSAPILGVIVRGDNAANLNGKLDRSDFLGAPETIYPDHVVERGMEMGNDRFEISADRLTLTVLRFEIRNPGDHIRVVTEIPAPASAAAFGLAVPLFRRRR